VGNPLFAAGRRSRPRLSQDARGYLLMETLIAVAIFTIGFLAIGTLIVSTARNNTTGNIATQAVLLASQTLEALKSTPDLGSLATREEHGPLDHRGEQGGIFWRSWTVDDPVGFDTSRQITVRVRWERLGRNRTIELSTLTKGNGT
jgi:type II secretory pathway component PulJ